MEADTFTKPSLYKYRFIMSTDVLIDDALRRKSFSISDGMYSFVLSLRAIKISNIKLVHSTRVMQIKVKKSVFGRRRSLIRRLGPSPGAGSSQT